MPDEKQLKKDIESLTQTKIEMTRVITELSKKKDEINKDIDKPIREAKTKAEGILIEVDKKSKEVLALATKTRLMADDYAKRVSEDAVNKLKVAKKMYDDGKKAQSEAAEKVIEVNNLRKTIEKQYEMDKAEIKAEKDKYYSLNKELGEFRIKLNEKEISLAKKEQGLNTKLENAVLAEKAIAKQQEIANETLLKIESIKQSMVSEKEANQKILNETAVLKRNIDKEKAENQVILDKTIKEREETEDKLNEIKGQSSALAVAREKNDEELKTLNEKDRWIKLQMRELDGKIKILKDLRSVGA